MRVKSRAIILCLMFNQIGAFDKYFSSVNNEIKLFIDCNVNQPINIVNLDDASEESRHFSVKLWRHLSQSHNILASLSNVNATVAYHQ